MHHCLEGRAYFKESLQLQRNGKFLTSQNFLKKLFTISLQFPIFFKVISFISCFQSINTGKTLKVQLHTLFLLTFLPSFVLKILGFSPLFSTLVLPHLQLQLDKCHFTTANYILQLQKFSSVVHLNMPCLRGMDAPEFYHAPWLHN